MNELFEIGMSPSLAYKEFIQSLRNECDSDLVFHKTKADRSKCPRRRDFNYLYSQFCINKFGGKNGASMFDLMISKIDLFIQENPETRINHQLYNAAENKPLIITIVTPFMKRIHFMVSEMF